MPLTRPTTDLDAKDALILQAAEATHYLASVLTTTNEKYWSLPDDRLLGVLNADVQATLATFAANSALATAVNASLDAVNLPQFAHRAPVAAGRSDVLFDGTVFSIAPAPVIADEPAPAPTEE